MVDSLYKPGQAEYKKTATYYGMNHKGFTFSPDLLAE